MEDAESRRENSGLSRFGRMRGQLKWVWERGYKVKGLGRELHCAPEPGMARNHAWAGTLFHTSVHGVWN